MSHPAVSPWRARRNRLQWVAGRALGWPGALGLAALVAALVLVAAVRPRLEAERVALLKAEVRRLDATPRPVAPVADPRDLARESLPVLAERGRSVATLLELFGRAGVEADQADYTAEDAEPGLVRLRVTVPIDGRYGAARALVASVLNTLPHAALDGLALERPDGAEALTGTLRFSLFFRKEGP